MRRLLYLLLTLVVLAALAVLALATPPGHAIVAGMIERARRATGSRSIGRQPVRLAALLAGADKIIASDADGVFAEGDNVSINVNVIALDHRQHRGRIRSPWNG